MDKVNQTTLNMLTKNSDGAGGSGGTARKITDIVAYKSVNDIHHSTVLAVQVRNSYNSCYLGSCFR